MRHSCTPGFVAFGIVVVLATQGKQVWAKIEQSPSSHVSATVAKADFFGSFAEELPAPEGQRRVRVHVRNQGTYGSGLTVVTIAYPFGWRMVGTVYRAGEISVPRRAFGPSLAWTLPDVGVGVQEEAIFTFEQAASGGEMGVAFSGQNSLVEYARLRLSPRSLKNVSGWRRWLGLST